MIYLASLIAHSRTVNTQINIQTALDTSSLKDTAIQLGKELDASIQSIASSSGSLMTKATADVQTTMSKVLEQQSQMEKSAELATTAFKETASAMAKVQGLGFEFDFIDEKKIKQANAELQFAKKALLETNNAFSSSVTTMGQWQSEFKKAVSTSKSGMTGLGSVVNKLNNDVNISFHSTYGQPFADRLKAAKSVAKDFFNELTKSAKEAKVPLKLSFDTIEAGTEKLDDLQASVKRYSDQVKTSRTSQEQFNQTLNVLDTLIIKTADELPELSKGFTDIKEATMKTSSTFEDLSDEMMVLIKNRRNLTFDDMNASLNTMISRLHTAGPQFQPLASSIQKLRQQVVDRKPYLDFTTTLKDIVTDDTIKDTGSLTTKLRGLSSTLRSQNTPAMDDLADSIDKVSDKSKRWDINKLKVALNKLADTTETRTGISSVINDLVKLQKTAEESSLDVEGLVDDLGKLGVSPQAIKSVTNFDNALTKMAVDTTQDARNNVGKLSKSIDKNADSMRKNNDDMGKLPGIIKDIANSGGSISKLFGKWSVLGSKFLITMGVVGSLKNIFRDVSETISAVARGLFNLGEQAAKMRDAETGFRNLASQTTSASVAMLRMRDASGEVIDRMTLMASATKAALAGIPAEQFYKLVTGARALAAVTGRDVNEALDRLTQSIAKQERRLLDELGIVIRAADVYREYKDKIGAATRELTAHEKEMAFFDEVISQINEKMAIMGGTLDEAQQPFLRLRTAAEDFKLSVGDWLLRHELSQAVTGVTNVINGLATAFSTAEQRFAQNAASVMSLVGQYRTFTDLYQEVIPEAERLSKVINSTTTSIDDAKDASDELEGKLSLIKNHFPELASLFKDDLADGLKEAAKQAKEMATSMEPLVFMRLSKTMREGTAVLADNISAQQRSAEVLEQLRKLYPDLAKQQSEFLARKGLYQPLTAVGQELADTMLDLDITQRGVWSGAKVTAMHIDDLEQALVNAKTVYNESSAAINDVSFSLADMLSNWKVTSPEVFKNIVAFSKLSKPLAETSSHLKEIVAQGYFTSQELLAMHGILPNIISRIDSLSKSTDGTSKAAVKWRNDFGELAEELKKIFGERIGAIEPSVLGIDRIREESKQATEIFDSFFDALTKNVIDSGKLEASIAKQKFDEILKLREDLHKAVIDFDADEADAIVAQMSERFKLLGIQDTEIKNLMALQKVMNDRSRKLKDAERKADEKALKDKERTEKEHQKKITDAVNRGLKDREDMFKDRQKREEQRRKQQIDIQKKGLDNLNKFTAKISNARFKITQATSQKQLNTIQKDLETGLTDLGINLQSGTALYTMFYNTINSLSKKSAELRIVNEETLADKISEITTLKGAGKVSKDIDKAREEYKISEKQSVTLKQQLTDKKTEIDSKFQQDVRNRIKVTGKTEEETALASIDTKEKVELEKINRHIASLEQQGVSTEESESTKSMIEEQAEKDRQSITDKFSDKRITNEISLSRQQLSFKRDILKEEMSFLDKTDRERINKITQLSLIEQQIRLNSIQKIKGDLIKLAEASITDEKVLAERKKEIDADMNKAIVMANNNKNKKIEDANKDHFDATLKEYQQFTEDVLKGFNVFFKQMGDEFDQAGKAIQLSIMAMVEPTPGAILSAAGEWVSLLDSIIEKSRRKQEEEIQRLKNLRDEMRQIASSIGGEIGDAITNNMSVDFNRLVQDFIRAEIAKDIAGVVADTLGPSLKDLTIGIQSTFGVGTEFEKSVEDTIDILKKAKTIAETFRGVDLKTAIGTALDEDIPEVMIDNVVAAIKGLGKAPSPAQWKTLATQLVKSQFGAENMARNMAETAGAWEKNQPRFRELVNTIRDTLGIVDKGVSEMSEQIPTATFRAVTEPQANQMLLLMGRQVDLLATISGHTAELASIKGILSGMNNSNVPNPNVGVIAPALDIEQAVSNNKRRESTGKNRINRINNR